MTIRLYKADALTKIEYYAKKTDQAFEFNDLVFVNSSGYLAPAADGVLFVPAGLIQATIASTDSDYSDATMVPVLVPGPDAEFLCDKGTGTPEQADIGTWADIDDELTVDLDNSTYDIFFITKIVNSSQVLAKMARKSGAAA